MAIKKFWVLIGSFLLGAPLGASADTAKPAAGQNIQESTPDEDKAAVQQAASEADKWAATHKEAPPAPKPVEEASAATTTTQQAKPVQTKPAAPAETAKPANAAALPGVTPPAQAPAAAPKPAVPHRTGLNEMKGKLLSMSEDPQTFRVIVDGGFNVEFSYDAQSTVVNGGEPIKMSELGYNDVVIVRYAGKDLYAVEVERVSKAPRPE